MIRFGVNKPVPVNLLMIVILVAGLTLGVSLRREFFPDDYHASTLVEVSKLAHPDLLIEINAIAVVS